MNHLHLCHLKLCAFPLVDLLPEPPDACLADAKLLGQIGGAQAGVSAGSRKRFQGGRADGLGGTDLENEK